MKFSPDGSRIVTRSKKSKREISAEYIINAVGGRSLDIADLMGLAEEYENLYFRGEYWQAPQVYSDLTHRSMHSVPKYAEYAFLDPHWIIMVDGRREIGPNAGRYSVLIRIAGKLILKTYCLRFWIHSLAGWY